MIPQQNIVAWSKVAPWAELRQVEQDLIIARALVLLFNDPLLAKELRFRGGTALNKLHFPKAHPHTETSAEYVATLLRMHAQRHMLHRGHVSEDACVVVDVFAGRIVSAQRGHVRRWRDIGAACDEIRRAWPDA